MEDGCSVWECGSSWDSSTLCDSNFSSRHNSTIHLTDMKWKKQILMPKMTMKTRKRNYMNFEAWMKDWRGMRRTERKREKQFTSPFSHNTFNFLLNFSFFQYFFLFKLSQVPQNENNVIISILNIHFRWRATTTSRLSSKKLTFKRRIVSVS